MNTFYRIDYRHEHTGEHRTLRTTAARRRAVIARLHAYGCSIVRVVPLF